VAATAARGAGAALEAAVVPFLEAAVAAVAVAAAAAAVRAAAAAAVSPESAKAGLLKALAHFLRSFAQAVLLFSLSRLRALVRRLASRCSAVRRLPWARARGGMGMSEIDVVWRPAGEVEALTPRARLKHHSAPAARSNARQILF
jgi:hypothetical protein